ncbi:hypothetical protein [Domibacillus epiphyticus]|uniref:Uncharacterized protein n=1 Tax=Domibacillus epiphyticus TaxID=1714355 RepID=A0A1V2A9C2_9BACI|nr:hypothetical protein [Domibacillus epiphyticus]OMP67588.1 hypothetical protein BTO28_06490 [Domibacillus epiphyticus]
MEILDFFNQPANRLPGFVILAIFFSMIVVTALLLRRKYKLLSTLSLTTGFFIYLLSSIISLGILTTFLFLNNDSYNNYGVGGSIIRLFISNILSVLVGFFLTTLFYSKQIKRRD